MKSEIIAPGATLGVLGSGQLGRMIALSAAPLGYRIAVLGPGGRDSPAGHVSFWAEDWKDPHNVSDEPLDTFCGLVSVVLIEWENVPVELVRRIERRGVPVRPDSIVLGVAQSRALEKDCAQHNGIPVPRYRVIADARDIAGFSGGILKTLHGGYDGRGQIRLSSALPLEHAWSELKRVPCILEDVVDFTHEISVIVARQFGTDSESRLVTYGPFENRHEGGILRTTTYPARVPAKAAADACEYARRLAAHFDLHGILAVEFFVTRDGGVLFNEMAPRPHNSGHLTIDACATSQFEQYVRAACNLPWGSMRFCDGMSVMHNIIGDELDGWLGHLNEAGTFLHLYGKTSVQPGRKMGHLTRTSVN